MLPSYSPKANAKPSGGEHLGHSPSHIWNSNKQEPLKEEKKHSHKENRHSKQVLTERDSQMNNSHIEIMEHTT